MDRRWTRPKESGSTQPSGRARENRSVRGVGVLRREYAQARAMSPPEAANTPDPMDAARAREEEAVRLAALQRRHELDTTVAEVLQSLATGQYGRCIECGQHIALARLRAMPLALRCLVCQERFERACRIAAARDSRYNVTHVQERETAL